ncbi:putative ABC transport system permease protein [Kineosphaera limosa]|uniref:ABC transporter permease n=1 Tax=Kineosphaera limosa TaxID=111564 RepID=UPI0002E3FF61|nr:ABC transporter permease [Kineosphaera limosa]NYE02011.1 putative ABC transport system permease protein [Kineosphaera limosa]
MAVTRARNPGPWSVLAEAWRPIARSPFKALLAAIGVAIGVAAFVMLAGMQGMNDAALVQRLDAASSNQVEATVELHRLPATLRDPRGIAASGDSLGLAQGFVSWRMSEPQVQRARPDGTTTVRAWPVVALTPDVQDRTDITTDRPWPLLFSSPRTALVGSGLVRTENIRPGETLTIDGHHVTVVGTITDSSSRPDLLLSVVVSDETSTAAFGPPESVTFSGYAPPAGAPKYAAALPRVLAPHHEEAVQSQAVEDARGAVALIGQDILSGTRYIGLSAALLGALMVGIIQYSSVIEKLGTYALKKSLGATSRQLFTELFLHSAIIGLTGGLLGLTAAALGLTTIATATAGTAYIAPWVPIAAVTGASLVGGLAGAAAGARAALVDPIAFIRR